jgi:DNA-binding MarR family transcriptional regulator
MSAGSTTRIANAAWEAMFRAQSTLALELAEGDVWDGLVPHDYGVLYALSTGPAEGLRMVDLRADVLLTQPGISRLVARLEEGGLVERADDPDDARAARIRLTAEGAEVQRRVGLAHGSHVADAMTRALDREELLQLQALCERLIGAAEDHRDGAQTQKEATA